MHGIHLSNKVVLSKIKASKLKDNIRLVTILVLIIDIEIAKTNASFLTIYWDICLQNGYYSYSKSI